MITELMERYPLAKTFFLTHIKLTDINYLLLTNADFSRLRVL